MQKLKSARVKKPAQARAWWKGGTLHNSQLKDWHDPKILFGNGLATAADWVYTFEKWPNRTSSLVIRTPDGTMDEEKFLAASLQLVTAITESSRNQPGAWHLRTSELALLAAYALGWLDDRQGYVSTLPQPLQADLQKTVELEQLPVHVRPRFYLDEEGRLAGERTGFDDQTVELSDDEQHQAVQLGLETQAGQTYLRQIWTRQIPTWLTSESRETIAEAADWDRFSETIVSPEV